MNKFFTCHYMPLFSTTNAFIVIKKQIVPVTEVLIFMGQCTHICLIIIRIFLA